MKFLLESYTFSQPSATDTISITESMLGYEMLSHRSIPLHSCLIPKEKSALRFELLHIQASERKKQIFTCKSVDLFLPLISEREGPEKVVSAVCAESIIFMFASSQREDFQGEVDHIEKLERTENDWKLLMCFSSCRYLTSIEKISQCLFTIWRNTHRIYCSPTGCSLPFVSTMKRLEFMECSFWIRFFVNLCRKSVVDWKELVW